MKTFSIAARINFFMFVVLLLIMSFSFISTQKLSKDILYTMSVESVLQRQGVTDQVLSGEKIQAIGVDASQWKSFVQDDSIIDLGFFVKKTDGDRLYWVEKTSEPNEFNVRGTKNNYQDYLVRLSLEFFVYLMILFAVLVPSVFGVSIFLLKPMASLRKISEDVLAGNYDVSASSYMAKDDLGRAMVAMSTLGENLKKNQIELEKVSELAIRDALTGLKNHRAFKNVIVRELATVKRHNRELGVVLLDVDKFKKFNDTYGHQQGDEVLKYVGKTLEGTARSSDFVARYGGEEFILLFPETGREGIFQACEKFREALEEMKVPNINAPGEFLKVTASFGGVSVVSSDIETVDGDDVYKPFVELCDQNMYKAKEKGRNCSVVSGMDS